MVKVWLSFRLIQNPNALDAMVSFLVFQFCPGSKQEITNCLMQITSTCYLLNIILIPLHVTIKMV